MISQVEITGIIQNQKKFFSTNQSKNLEFRIHQLKTLKKLIINHESEIIQALQTDLGKPFYEAFGTEIFVLLTEINYVLKNLRKWVKPQSVSIPLQFLPGRGKIIPEPLGVVLIISPWNYPLQLVIAPLIGAIAAGNCAIIKPSEVAAATSQLIARLISEYFAHDYITVITGGVETTQALLTEKFDHIFFTGGAAVGKIIMAAAAKHLTPVTLELGGKSPCIVDHDINLEVTARRILWGKFLNCGQTCLAPDYLLVDARIKADLISEFRKCLREFYGENPVNSPDYGRIINQARFDKLLHLLESTEIIMGGENNPQERYIAPTIVNNVRWDHPLMQEEIFGPILPIIEYTNISEAIAHINSQPQPLALYLFSHQKSLQEQVLTTTSSGGVCINDTILHRGVPTLPFGGVSNSGIGSYHGKFSFDRFSHHKSVFQNPVWLDLKWRYAPYAGKIGFLRRFL
ncbi:aldehyde dehydrogenase [Calothrix sp. 336/3]|uniref:aldehyde dehydrogenase n=1 Tax=Calothrix sp. 336/3 TaxID=1337936 RepID=UPI0004E3CFD8|nr:aldehyde dehydrogenase [Calothrix sp. 336/3]AKG21831.1 aldehyde dehydrogenase [Calothrix sp. 336/3]